MIQQEANDEKWGYPINPIPCGQEIPMFGERNGIAVL